MPKFKRRLDVTFEAEQYFRPKGLPPGAQVMVYKFQAGFVILKDTDWLIRDGMGPDGYQAYQIMSDQELQTSHELADPKVSEPEPQEPDLTSQTRTL